MKGCDTSTSLTANPKFISCLKSQGYEFVCRYLSPQNRHKCLTKAEAQTLTDAGLLIVSVWENGSPTTPDYFSYKSGLQDGLNAHRFAVEEINQPAGSVIFFAVDIDLAPQVVRGNVHEYFTGIRDAFNQSGNHYRIGGYGSGSVLNHLLDNGLIVVAWLANAHGWQGFSSFVRWSIKQGAQTMVCGFWIDPDMAQGDFGAWSLNAQQQLPPQPSARTLYLTQPMMRGADVQALQDQFVKLGRLNPNHVDGVFGKECDAVVRAFQEDEGLAIDGKVGAQTRAYLNSALA